MVEAHCRVIFRSRSTQAEGGIKEHDTDVV